MTYTGKKVLITGAAGFLGSHLARRLVKIGADVYVLVRESSDLWRIKDIMPQITLRTGDLKDFEWIKKIISEIKPAGIFHLAASTLSSGVTADLGEVVASNFIGTVNLINAYEDYDYDFFVNTGSFTEYEKQDRPIKESDPHDPPEIYNVTKLSSGLFARAYAKNKDKPIITLRLFTPYGPYIQKGRLVYQIISGALAGADLNLTRHEVARDYVFMDDLVELYLEAGDKAGKYKGEFFNAGTGIKTSIGELVDYVLRKTESKSKVNWGAFRNVVYDSDNWQANMAKTFSHFEWRPRTRIQEGLDKTIGWFMSFYKK